MGIPKLFPDGTGTFTEEKWRIRRKELIRLFSGYEYGFTPDIQLDQVSCSKAWAAELKDGVSYEMRRLFFRKGETFTSLRFELFYRQSDKALPIFLFIDVFDSSPDNLDCPEMGSYSMARIPYEEITRRGYAVALIHAGDICNDCPRTYQRGIMEIAPRTGKSGWGAIGAWAWAASRVVDYVYRDPRFDENKITVIGVSRAGKTALWCGAQDERIAAVIAVVSGCGGASLFRGKKGEHIKDITGKFPHWTCEKFAEFSDCEDKLPVDQHMLLALCAPRPLYISDAIEDEWADPHKAFEAAKLAEEAYVLCGKKGVGGDRFPNVHEPLNEGDIAYHVRTGGHGLLPYDWEQYLNFLDRHFAAD